MPNAPTKPEVIVIDRPTVIEREAPKVEHPKMYSVLLLNDDYTPAELVSDILSEVFGLNEQLAWQKMMDAHRSGRANVGTFSKDVAETKIAAATAKIQAEGEYPIAFDLQEAA